MIYTEKKKSQKINWYQRMRTWKEQVSREQLFQEQICQHLNAVFSGEKQFKKKQED
jgi:DNA phosphorothioation-dependent restriction protein DptG